MKKKIFLVTGGSGGHFFPALALSKIMKKEEFEFIFLVDDRVENLAKSNFCNYFKVLPPRFTKSFFHFLKSFFKISFSVYKTINLILKYKPNLIIGFGGYTSIFPIILGRILGTKTLIHEQNAIIGKANKLLSSLGTEVALTFKKTFNAPKESIFTGIPVREKKVLKKKKKKKIILVIGGSQGANIFSILLPMILKSFSRIQLKKILIIQQVRKEDQSKLQKEYKKLGVEFNLKNFFDDIYIHIAMSDIIFSRCGSSTLAEIQLYRKFSVLLPLTTSMDNHQKLNANEFKKKNQCLIVNEKKIDYPNVIRIFKNELFKKKLPVKEKKLSQGNSLPRLIKKILS